MHTRRLGKMAQRCLSWDWAAGRSAEAWDRSTSRSSLTLSAENPGRGLRINVINREIQHARTAQMSSGLEWTTVQQTFCSAPAARVSNSHT
jgi:hypothetical protein